MSSGSKLALPPVCVMNEPVGSSVRFGYSSLPSPGSTTKSALKTADSTPCLGASIETCCRVGTPGAKQ